MSIMDELTDIDWPSSFYSSDDSSVESTQNPYRHADPTHTPRTDTTTLPSIPHPSNLPNTRNQQLPITHWLTRHTAPINDTPPAAPLHLPTVKLRQLQRRKSHIQFPIHELIDNNHWGDVPSQDPTQFRIISKNVNTLSTDSHNLQWRGAAQALVDLDAHVLCLQEPNTNWTDTLMQPIYRIFQQTFLHAKLTTSASIDKDNANYQPGGTFIAVVGCYAARIITTGSDTTGLGRWTYNELIGRNGRRFLIVNAYRIGNQQPTIGSRTICTQQYQILLQQGQLNPNPREQFVADFITLVQQWQRTHEWYASMPTIQYWTLTTTA